MTTKVRETLQFSEDCFETAIPGLKFSNNALRAASSFPRRAVRELSLTEYFKRRFLSFVFHLTLSSHSNLINVEVDISYTLFGSAESPNISSSSAVANLIVWALHPLHVSRQTFTVPWTNKTALWKLECPNLALRKSPSTETKFSKRYGSEEQHN